MADIPLLNNMVSYFLLLDFDPAGGVVSAVNGESWTVTSSAPNSLQMAVGTVPAQAPTNAGAAALICTPLVQVSDSTNGGGGIAADLVDSTGLAPRSIPTFSIEQNTAPAAFGIGATPVFTTTQPVPAATGP